MKPNTKHYELRICVYGICNGFPPELRHARRLRDELFESDEEFRVYFGLKENGPAMDILFGGEEA